MVRWLLLLLLFCLPCYASDNVVHPFAKAEEIKQPTEPIELRLFIYEKPMFPDWLDEYERPVENYDDFDEYQGLRKFVYKQASRMAQRYASKLLDTYGIPQQDRIVNLIPPAPGFQKPKWVVGSKEKVASVGPLSVFNDGRINWRAKKAQEMVGWTDDNLIEFNADLPDAKWFKCSVAVSASIKEKVETCEVGITTKWSLLYKGKQWARLRVKGEVKGDLQAALTAQLVIPW